ncbi:BatA domain-containing protein [Rosistilla oblonga]|uniref:BatA domain-containing protein n=1 Tax=Rosistilla oblonga TaxID=2527990 RepID=UPI003A96AFF8
MSFLAPLYALGALAIGLPILFHLIRRRPKAQAEFSSLMFLTQSPPRLTRRSRLDQWPLLLLRALAILLLALAFARPFLRSMAQQETDPIGRRVVVLVDTSGSMLRGDLWQQAQQQVASVTDDLAANDQIALLTYDSAVTSVVSWDDQAVGGSSSQAERIRRAMADITPSHGGSDLGAALIAAADILHNTAESIEEGDVAAGEIVIVSDLQEGNDLIPLQQYQWPASIAVSIAAVELAEKGNLSAVVLPQPVASGESKQPQLRVRFHNTSDSVNDQFMYFWEGGKEGEDRIVQVPPGESRVVMIDPPAGTQHVLRFVGDQQAFDNQVYVALPPKLQQRVLYVGSQAEDPQSGLFYFLNQATLGNARREVAIEQVEPGELPAELKPQQTPLVIVADVVPSAAMAGLKQYLGDGGHLLFVIDADPKDDSAIAASLRELSDSPSLAIEEAKVGDYAMLAKIDFQHPLFAPFADPKYNDFTKIRFWSHRRLTLAEEDGWRTIAEFDDNDPALIQRSIGAGRLWVLTAGWQPQQSQLALSTKFVPLISGMLDQGPNRSPLEASYAIGMQGALPVTPPCELVSPDGTRREIEADLRLEELKQLGVYRLIQSGVESSFAMNLPESESRTVAIGADQLEQYGLQMQRSESAEQIADRQRQLQDVQLESQQKIWQWMIFAALGILVTETWLGGYLAGRKG